MKKARTPGRKQNRRETAGSSGNEASRDPSEERARNPKEQQVLETRRNDPKTAGADSTENCNTAGRGGRPREREKEPVMAGGSGGGRRPGTRRAMEEDQTPNQKGETRRDEMEENPSIRTT